MMRPRQAARARRVARRRARDRRRLERRHLVANPDRGGDQAHRQRRPGPLPRAAGRGRAAAGGRGARGRPRAPARSSGAPRSAAARWPAGAPTATSAAAPVMKPSRTTGMRASAAPTMTPTSSAISRPPTAAQDADRVAPVGLVDLERALDGRDLAPVRGVVDAGPPAGDARDRPAGQDRADGARRRRVADPHLADPEEVDAVGRELAGEIDAGRHRAQCLGAGHRRTERSCRRSRRGSWPGRAGRHAPGRRRRRDR